MSSSGANLSVWVGDHLVCVRISGRASFNCSVDFRTLVTSLWQKGYNRFVLDLTNCQLMDSTFLGVLAGLGMRFNREPNGCGPATIELFNTSPRIAEMLDNLGVSHLFKTLSAPPLEPAHLTRLEQPETQGDRKEISRTCLEAHKLLMDLNPANAAKFKDVTRFLEEDLKKLEG
jgi:anti-sigma B factor antagonist